MRFIILLLVTLLVATQAFGRNCTHAPVSETQQDRIQQDLSQFLTSTEDAHQGLSTIYIPTYVHIINAGNSPNQGNVPNAMIEDQIRVLNAAFAPVHIQFQLQGLDRTTNVAWSKDMMMGNEAEWQAKSSLRVGGRNTLNLYIARLQNGVLGYATFPFELYKQPALDGVVIMPTTLPGGKLAPYNLGLTAVHEVGHWLGLYHTFQGGCRNRDFVDDTPAEASPASGCPIGRKSCENCEGVDPVQNFMDYSDDACMNHFTEGQMLRMHAHWHAYRDPGSQLALARELLSVFENRSLYITLSSLHTFCLCLINLILCSCSTYSK
jgi:hypothetical protein